MQTQAQPVEIVTASERFAVGTAQSYSMETRGDIPRQWQAFFAAGYDISNATGVRCMAYRFP